MTRKYRQAGYQDKSARTEDRPRTEPRAPREGPKSPKMPGFHEVMRCAMCGATLPSSFDEITDNSQCPKCKADLHTCRNCVFFDPASRFECTQPIPERIARKNMKNSCEFFEARSTVEKVTTSSAQLPLDPRAAFENLFKK